MRINPGTGKVWEKVDGKGPQGGVKVHTSLGARILARLGWKVQKMTTADNKTFYLNKRSLAKWRQTGAGQLAAYNAAKELQDNLHRGYTGKCISHYRFVVLTQEDYNKIKQKDYRPKTDT